MELLHHILEWVLCRKEHAKPQGVYHLDGDNAILLWYMCTRCNGIIKVNEYKDLKFPDKNR